MSDRALGVESGAEAPIDPVRGTRDWGPREYARFAEIESKLMSEFALAGYAAMQTPVLEYSELHERKSGAAIVSKLYELAGDHQSDARLCLRPELTASIVRAFAASPLVANGPPHRVSMAGQVFRYEPPTEDRLREFRQVGFELLGAGGPRADAEVIALADRSLARGGLAQRTIRLGHVGVVLEALERSGVPPALRSTLLETLGDAAAQGIRIGDPGSALHRLIDRTVGVNASVGGFDPSAAAAIVPEVTGRRTREDVIERLRRKWELARSLAGRLDSLAADLAEIASIQGRADQLPERLAAVTRRFAPESAGSLLKIIELLEAYDIAKERIEIDLGFGRGIGFYTSTVFEIVAVTPLGTLEIGGGGRYDGLATVLGGRGNAEGAGFAVGLERLARALDLQAGARSDTAPQPRSMAYVAPLTESAWKPAIEAARAIRERGETAVLATEIETPDSALAAAQPPAYGRLILVRGEDSAPAIEEIKIADK